SLPGGEAVVLELRDGQRRGEAGGAHDHRLAHAQPRRQRHHRIGRNARDFRIAPVAGFRQAAAGDQHLLTRLDLGRRRLDHHAGEIHAAHQREAPEAAAAAGAGQRILVVDVRPVDPDGDFARRQVGRRQRLDAGAVGVDAACTESLHAPSLRSKAMKHSTRFAFLSVILLAMPLAASQAAAPARIEQGNLIFDGIPVEEVMAEAELPLVLESRSASFVDWLADGSMVIATRFGNTTQLHRVPAPLAMREQFTFKSEPVTAAVAHPYDANRLLFLKDEGGNERLQIWLRDMESGEERLLTDGRSRHGQPVFARDGRRVAFHGNARDGASNDLYLADIDSPAAPRLLLAGGSDALYVQDWSLTDRQVAVIRYRSITDSELFLLDVDTGEQVRVEPAVAFNGANGNGNGNGRRRNGAAPATVSVAQARFAHDGRGLFYNSDRGGEFPRRHHYDVYTREVRALTPGTNWDVERFDL